MNWIELAHNCFKLQALVKTVMSFPSFQAFAAM